MSQRFSALTRFGSSNWTWKDCFLSFSLYLVLALVLLLRHLGPHQIIDNGDYLVNSWVMAWPAHAIVHDAANLFNGNIFFPARGVLSFGEFGPASWPLFFPCYWLSHDNLNRAFPYFLSIVIGLNGLAVAWLAFRFSRDRVAALIAPAYLCFSAMQLAEIAQPQYFSMWCLPITLMAYHNWQVKKTALASFSLSACLVVAACCAMHFLLMLVLCLGFLELLRWRREGLNATGQFIGALSVAAICIVFIYRTMVQRVFSGTMGSTLSVGMLTSGEAGLDVLISLWALPTILLSVLFLARKRWVHSVYLSDLLMACAGLSILSLGPLLKWGERVLFVPLPYAAIMFLPGFGMLRAPARLLFIPQIVIAVVIGCALSVLLRIGMKYLTASRAVSLAACALFALIPWALADLHFEKTMSPPNLPENEWLRERTDKDAVIAELPLTGIANELYTYGSTFHWRPLMNGSSSYDPPSYYPFAYNTLRSLPNPDAIRELAAFGDDYLVVHTSGTTVSFARQLEHALVNVAGRLGDTVIYDMRSAKRQLEKVPQVAVLHSASSFVLPAQRDVSFVFAATISGARWKNARVNDVRAVTAEWVRSDGTKSASSAKVELPPFILEEKSGAPIKISVKTPSAGDYTLKLADADLNLDLSAHVSQAQEDEPQIGKLLDAQLLESGELGAGTTARIVAKVQNTGIVSWLGGAKSRINLSNIQWRGSMKDVFNQVVRRSGPVFICTFWDRVDNGAIQKAAEPASTEGIWPLVGGGEFPFGYPITVPSAPGTYQCRIQLVREDSRTTDASGKTNVSNALLDELVLPKDVVVSSAPNSRF